MKKTTKQESLISQIKAIPNQVKIFILGLFLVVLALASVLPNLDSKSLQGSVLNIETESKGNSYDYSDWRISVSSGYGFCTMNCVPSDSPSNNPEMVEAYRYGIKNGFTVASNIENAHLYKILENDRTKFLIESFAKKVYWVDINFWLRMDETITTKQQFLGMLSSVLWPNWWISFSQYEELGVSIDNIKAPLLRWDALLILKKVHENFDWNTEDICQTPENISACSLGLESCPEECRGTQESKLIIENALIDIGGATKVGQYKSTPSSKIKNVGNKPFVYQGIQWEISLTVWCWEDEEHQKLLFVTYFDKPFTLQPGESIKSEQVDYDKRHFIQNPFFQTEGTKEMNCRIFLGGQGSLDEEKVTNTVLPGTPNMQKPNPIITKLMLDENGSNDWEHLRFSMDYTNIGNNYVSQEWVKVECKYNNKTIFSKTIMDDHDFYFVEGSMAGWSYVFDVFTQEPNNTKVICTIDPENLLEEADEDDNVYVLKLNQIQDTCKTPENILACDLQLADCPQQCRPEICQTSENILACPLGLASCPEECRYGSTIHEAPSYRTEWLNRDTPSGNGDYETYKDFTPVPCKDGYKPTNAEFVRIDWKTNQKIHVSPAGGYCLNSENPEWCVNHKIKFYCEKFDTNEMPVVEKPRTVETAKTIKDSSSSISTKTSIEEKTTAQSTILDIFKELLK